MKFFFYLILFFNLRALSQCPEGAIGVTGAGCGCLANCNLTSFGGPNCGAAGVGGNCTAGQVAMSVDIIVPDGCTFTVTAVMQNRPGCSASGGDGGDQLKVDIPGGPKPFQTGASNATLTDSYTLAGPATIRISGTANRADEIITYTTSYSGAFCDACGSILPIGISDFSGIQKDRSIQISWTTNSELNTSHYELFRSTDGINFEFFNSIQALGNSTHNFTYNIVDTEVPMVGKIYYKLNEINNDGAINETKIMKVDYEPQFVSYYNGILRINIPDHYGTEQSIQIYDPSGKIIEEFLIYESYTEKTISLEGLYLVVVPERKLRQKIVAF